MTYSTVADIMDSTSMIRRENAALAKEGIDPPEGWQYEHRWKLAASPGWDAAWDSALASHPDDPTYDPGDDQGVITDGMILSAIQGMIEADKPPIEVVAGMTVDVAHDHPKVVAVPTTPWDEAEYATFDDGFWRWTGGAWAPFLPGPLPGPVITVLEPSSASITDPDFEGHLRGTGFTEDTVIIWNGAEEPTNFVDSTDVWTTVVPSVVTAPTVLDVYVRNGDGQVSGILPFTWEA